MAGFQMGSFAGALANSGLNTFLQISQYKRQKDQLDREQQDRDTQKTAFSKVGQQDYTQGIQNASSLTPEQSKVINDWAQQQAGGNTGLQQQLVQQRVADSANGLDPINQAALQPTTYTQAQAYHDIASKLNDPKMGMQYQQMGTALDKEAQLKTLFGASDQMFGGDVQGGLNTLASLHNSSVQNGYTSSVQNDPTTGKPMYILTNQQTGQQQRFDPTTPLAQNALIMRAAAAIDPEKYAPLAQHAVGLWAKSGLEGQQQSDTAQHNLNTTAVQANTSNNSALNNASEADYRQRMAGVAEQNANTTEQFRKDTIRQWDEGLRQRGGALDPNKALREQRAEQMQFIKENPNLYSVQADPEGKPTPHPGMLALTNNLLKATDAATTQQTMLSIQAQAAQQATDPNTGKMDYGKYIASLNAITDQATRALAARVGAGVKPGNQTGTGGGVTPQPVPYASQPSQKVIEGMKREKARQDRAAGLKATIKGAAQNYADAYEQNPYGMTY